MKESSCRSLIEVLGEMTDPRREEGKRYSLPAILGLACVAMLCGYRSYSAIAEWGRHYGKKWVMLLGFKEEETPCAATFYNVLKAVDRQEVETKLGGWVEEVLNDLPSEEQEEAIAVDGKTLRGSRKQGAPAAHLLSAVGHRLGLTLAQVAVDEKTNEIPMMLELLDQLVIKGRVFTMDALLTQEKIAKRIVAEGGDYVMIVKENQPTLHEDLQTLFEGLPQDALQGTQVKVVDMGHGRIEERRLETSPLLNDYLQWPGLQQVFRLQRKTLLKKRGEEREETVYGITSLSETKADAEKILGFARGHWGIENRSHWVRDVTFDEDRSQVRQGSIPQLMAALRNTVIGLMRWSGEKSIAAATRRFAAQPAAALALIGVTEN